MKKLLIALALVIICGNANAEWIEVDFIKNRFIIYADKTTIRRNENIVKMWELTDFKMMQKNKDDTEFLSVKALQEHDCKEGRSRLLDLAQYSGAMGKGGVIMSGSDFGDRWNYVSPESIAESIWKIACGKR